MYIVTRGVVPAVTVDIVPSIRRATAPNGSYAGFWAPLAAYRPLCHGLPALSWNTNQMNICTFGSFFAMFSACTAYFAWVAYETPCGLGGLVW